MEGGAVRIGKRDVLTLIWLTAVAILVWWPLWFMLTGAFTASDELSATIGAALSDTGKYATWHLLPSWPTLRTVTELLLDTPQFFVMFWNSAGQVFPQLLGQLLFGAPAAWALSRFKFRGRGALSTLYIVLMLMPFQVTMVPNYLVLNKLGLMDTVWAIILPGTFSAFPVFIMKKGFDAVPQALLEAAKIDGADRFQAFIHIGLPMGLPGILSALILSFLEGWNAIEQPMTFLKTQSNWPLSLYLSSIDTRNIAGLGIAFAASLVMLLPAAFIFRFGQKYLELGIQAGSLKE